MDVVGSNLLQVSFIPRCRDVFGKFGIAHAFIEHQIDLSWLRDVLRVDAVNINRLLDLLVEYDHLCFRLFDLELSFITLLFGPVNPRVASDKRDIVLGTDPCAVGTLLNCLFN